MVETIERLKGVMWLGRLMGEENLGTRKILAWGVHEKCMGLTV